jgi:putative effector of murein hydrolase
MSWWLVVLAVFALVVAFALGGVGALPAAAIVLTTVVGAVVLWRLAIRNRQP